MADEKRISGLDEVTTWVATDYIVQDKSGDASASKTLVSSLTAKMGFIDIGVWDMRTNVKIITLGTGVAATINAIYNVLLIDDDGQAHNGHSYYDAWLHNYYVTNTENAQLSGDTYTAMYTYLAAKYTSGCDNNIKWLAKQAIAIGVDAELDIQNNRIILYNQVPGAIQEAVRGQANGDTDILTTTDFLLKFRATAVTRGSILVSYK